MYGPNIKLIFILYIYINFHNEFQTDFFFFKKKTLSKYISIFITDNKWERVIKGVHNCPHLWQEYKIFKRHPCSSTLKLKVHNITL